MTELINTTIGLVDISELTIIRSAEQVPCGECVTTKYLKDGQIVRQDIHVNVTNAPAIGASGGL